MISSYDDLINKIKLEKISMKELVEIINLNGFTKEKLNELLTLVTLSKKYRFKIRWKGLLYSFKV